MIETFEEYFTGASQSVCSDKLWLWEESLARYRSLERERDAKIIHFL